MKTKKQLHPLIKGFLFIICGIAVSLIGFMIGALLSGQDSVSYFKIFIYGGEVRYENSGITSGFIGAAIMCIILIYIWLKKLPTRKRWIAFYLGCWFIALTLSSQYFQELMRGYDLTRFLFSPIILMGTVYAITQYIKTKSIPIKFKKHPLVKAILFTVFGGIMSLLGLFIGAMFGGVLDLALYMKYGDNYDNLFYAGKFIATSTIISLIGMAIACIILISIWFQKSTAKKGWIAFYMGFWFIIFVTQLFYILQKDISNRGSIPLLFVPIIATGILYGFSQYSKKLSKAS